MTTLQLRRAAGRRLRALPPEKLRVAAEFLTWLETSASDEATAELLRLPGLVGEVRRARREIAAGRGVDWRKVRRVGARG
jgi:hypothetical protein